MKKIRIALLFMILYLPFTAFSLSTPQTGTMKGNDGKTYQTVRIGNQVWMAENLRETQYRNGDALPAVTDNAEWIKYVTGAYCAYENSAANGSDYGFLYNWHAVHDSRNIAPQGWRVPTDNDWKELEAFLGMSRSDTEKTGWRGSGEGDMLKNASKWGRGSASDAAGFSALPAGYRYNYGGAFIGMDMRTTFWSSSAFNASTSWTRTINYDQSGIGRFAYFNSNGFSIRFIQN